VNASRNVSLQPDQAVFSVTVQSGITASLDDVVAALQGSGITAANLLGVSSLQSYLNIAAVSALSWVFSLPVPLANTKATVASLTTLAQNIGKLNNGLTLSFNIVGTQVSQQLAQSQTCSLAGLVADATTQAQSLASAGGLTLGAILALSGATSNIASTPPPCSITVKFKVTRY